MHHDLHAVEPTPEIIRQAMEKGRRERSAAVWALFGKLFGRRAAAPTKSEVEGGQQPAGASAAMLY